MIAGYLDDVDRAYRGPLPVVLFGDHTRIFKYVDHPFALGADGVKVLSPKGSTSAKFLYYFFQSIEVPSRGYSRHFKFLREKKVPDVHPDEQRRIVEILDQADALRKLRREADALSERILPAVFYKMFGDPVRNEKGWEPIYFGDVVDIGTQLVDPSNGAFDDLLHVGGENIESDTGRLIDLKSVRESHLRSGKFSFTTKHILYSKIRPYLNKVAYPKFDGLCSADIYPLLPRKKRILPLFLISLLRTRSFLAFAHIHSERLRMAKLNSDQLSSFEFGLPPFELQESFESRSNEIAQLDSLRHESSDKVGHLFSTLLHRAFSGELTAKWREENDVHLEL
jgi:type I restriction enzyme S subunit